MKLPNGRLAAVEREKIVDYLLNVAHPDNGGKSKFFLSLGFRVEQWEVLAETFRELACNSDVAQEIGSMHGRKFIVEGEIKGPDGKVGAVRSIWIIDRDRENPRLVTGYPWR